MAAHSSFVSNNHPACSIRSPCPFCVHARSLSRYARSCFARQLLRSLHSHSPAILWQMLRYVRQVFVGSSQIIKPFPCHLPHSLSNCQFPMPLNKKCATPAGGSRRQAPSCFGLPPSTTLAPLASARASSLRKEKTRRFAPQFFLCSVPAQGCITCSQQFYHFLKLFYQIQIPGSGNPKTVLGISTGSDPFAFLSSCTFHIAKCCTFNVAKCCTIHIAKHCTINIAGRNTAHIIPLPV